MKTKARIFDYLIIKGKSCQIFSFCPFTKINELTYFLPIYKITIHYMIIDHIVLT